MKTTGITCEALSLPMEEIDKQWVDVAQKRLRELRSGEVNAVSGEEVFKRIWDQFARSFHPKQI
jgi:hypothetical protein